jgi:hypothetical protein
LLVPLAVSQDDSLKRGFSVSARMLVGTKHFCGVFGAGVEHCAFSVDDAMQSEWTKFLEVMLETCSGMMGKIG